MARLLSHGATISEQASQTELDLKANLASPTLVTPDIGTPTAGVMTNVTGTAAGLTAGNVTTNATLTGHITSSGNAATLGAFTVAQLSSALSDASISGNNTGDQTLADINALDVTELGTVTSANLSNSAIVYPAGHVVQVVGDAVDIQSTTVTTAWDFATAIVQVITPKLDNSSMIISAYFLSYNLAASTNYFDLYRNSSTLTETYNLSTDDRGMAAQEHHTTGSSEWQGLSLLWLDNSSEMTGRGDKNAITYKLTCKTSNGNRAYINNSSRAKLVVMEIAV